MKLNWFSPLLSAKTDVAHYTGRVLSALSALARVTLWSTDTAWDSSLERYATIRHFRPQSIPWAEINQADMSIFQIGNNPGCHGAIWKVSQRQPGLVVVHDPCLQHFFAGLAIQEGDRDGYLAHMERYYGAAGRRAGERLWQDPVHVNHVAERYPLSPLAVENALGVLVHTRDAYHEFSRLGRWPVVHAPLPYAATPRLPLNAVEGRSGDEKELRLIVFGHIGKNRRLESLLHALGTLPEKQRYRLAVYGQLVERERVTALIQKLHLSGIVSLHGFVPEAELDSALASAHLAVNLRYPTMGEASGSQLRIWNHALPSLVTQVGWYASLPEDAVAFVRPDHEIEDLKRHLLALAADPASYAARGASGRRTLEEQHSPESYARTIVRFVENLLRFRPRLMASHLASRVGAEMSAWMNAGGSVAGYRHAAEEIHRIAS